ncbi:hypothetical protein SCUCBS95973_005738 [Sporothrix curviconia]|uniref:Uncharacterized protein n=1 Tax=Sporothrix curviconia TaxID=1260050 RepID=A0ABP0BZF9_9PEZI
MVIVALLLAATTLAILSTRPLHDQPEALQRLVRFILADDSTSEYHRHGLLRPRQSSVDPPSGDLPAPGPLNSSSLSHGPGGPLSDGPYTFYCGIFNTGMPATIRQGALSLRVVNFTYTLQAGTCERVYCYDTSAVYVCNNNVQVPGGTTGTAAIAGYDIGWMADRLSLLCCDPHHGTSAQLFHPTAGWNTVVGYGNCRHDPAEPPSAYGTGNGGVNGDCIPGESRPSPGTGNGEDVHKD